ncbi:MAG: PAS domain S-box protein [Planctomycetota bacterium]|nr:PAS domain S-box protein [Planctomycetota bacterium]MDA1162914.1 PAS domain S-box protein [Planctomycetota bacterium]
MPDQPSTETNPQRTPDDTMFRAIVEGAVEGILVHRDQKPLYVNEAWARLHGLTIDDVLAMDDVLPLIHASEHPRILNYMEMRMRGDAAPTQYEYRGVRADGSVFWLENRVRPIVWCGEPAIQATVMDISRRKKAEQALHLSEEHFRSGFEDGTIGVCFVDSDLRFIRVNRAFCDMTGYTSDELLNLTTLDLALDEDCASGSPRPDTTPHNFSDFSVRKKYVQKDKGIVWVRVSAHWIYDDDRQPAYRLTLVENVTDRVQARLAVEASEKRFRNLVEGSIQGVLIHRNDRPLFVNETWAQIFGYTADEVHRTDSTLKFAAPEEHERLREYREARIAGESAPTRYEYQGLRKNGSIVWLENNVRVVDWDGGPAIQSTIIDCTQRKLREEELETFNEELERRVAERTAELESANDQLLGEITERLRAETELRQSRALYESLVETIPLCVARKNLAGEFVFANRALRDTFDKTLEEIVGFNDYDFSPRELADQYRKDDQRVIDTGEQLDFVETSRFRGENRHIQTMKTPIRDLDGTISGTQLVFWDITPQAEAAEVRKAAQEELELRNRDLTSLLYVISHDLKEPVRAIQSFSMLIKEAIENQLDERTRGFLQRVIDASERMQNLLDDVLLLSRAQQTVDASSDVDLSDVVKEVLQLLSGRIEQSGATISIDEILPTVTGDRRWLIQAVQNLVANALKFTSPDCAPEIEIATANIEDIGDAEAGLVVRDRGPGVDEAHRERIFDLFQRAVGRSVEGTGAGLAIVRGIAERHGGGCRVVPREGGGSQFILTFGSMEN